MRQRPAVESRLVKVSSEQHASPWLRRSDGYSENAVQLKKKRGATNVPEGEPEANAREYFLEAYREFEQKHEFTARIFKVVGGQKRDQRRFWANLLFLRLSMIGFSLLHLCLPELRNREKNPAEATCALDPTSISAVGRTLLEACVMFLYVSELSVPEPEWSLRRKGP
jgi:hypothetical protein